MRASELHEELDTHGLLVESRNPGVYALEVQTPDTSEEIARAFRDVCEAAPPEGQMDSLTHRSCAYVGASQIPYERLMDHANGRVRQSVLLQAFGFVDIINIWPVENPLENEMMIAYQLSEQGWRVWCDGRVI